MHPPSWVVRELMQVSKWARLGWLGRPRRTPDQLNPGEFMLLDLIKSRHAELTFKEPWASRGPIFGPHFDPLARVPVMVKSYSPEDVFSGLIVADVRRMRIPLRERLAEAHWAKENAYRASIHDLAGEMGQELYWKAQRSSEGGIPIVPQKDLTAHDKEVLTGEWKQHVSDKAAPEPSAVALL